VRHVRFQNGGDPREGVLDGDTIRPAGDGAPVALADVRLLAPVVPGKVIAVGQNYMDHIREQGAKPPGIPVLFPKFATCVIGPGDEIRWPATLTTRVDYEGELAVVIGTRASRVPVEERSASCAATRSPTTSAPATCRSATGSGYAARRWTRSCRSGPPS
jgi:2-keto-4-pentenoate hydratase/2-oxohepta-3-ene-1,7-dioic acid hydratase in catechol pathway